MNYIQLLRYQYFTAPAMQNCTLPFVASKSGQISGYPDNIFLYSSFQTNNILHVTMTFIILRNYQS
jgi:hypothetical protein